MAARRPYSQDDSFRARHVMRAALSPDGTTAVYELSAVQGSGPQERQSVTLWRWQAGHPEPSPFSAAGLCARAPAFTPDARQLLYLGSSAASQPAQVWRQDLAGGEPERLSAFDQGVLQFALCPRGERLALVVGAPGARGDAAPHLRLRRRNYRLDTLPGAVEQHAQAIFLLDLDDRSCRQLTAFDGILSELVWSPDGEEIAFIRGAGQATEAFAYFGALCVSDLRGGERCLLADQLIQLPFWLPESDRIGYCTPPQGDLTRQSQLWLIPSQGGEPLSRTSTLDCAVPVSWQINNPAGGHPGRIVHDGGYAYVSAGVGGQGQILKIALDGPEAVEAVVSGPRSCRLEALAAGQLLFSVQDCCTPGELHRLVLATGEESALSRHNARRASEIAWPQLRHQLVESEPGVKVEVWSLSPPAQAAPNRAILYLHGGPHAAFTWACHEDMLELVGAGFTVIFVNPRGSTGYGDAFSQAIVGCWGEPERRDCTAVLDQLIGDGLIDPERIGVMGVSGGGHLSAWLVTQLRRFRAAVPEQGIYNLFSAYGTVDVGVELIGAEMAGDPDEQPERYWALSPVAHARHCRTPTLLIQGEEDWRCPMSQAEEMFTALRRHGCEAELLRLAGCHHMAQVTGPPPLRRYRMDAIKEWFGRHLVPPDSRPEAAIRD